MKRYIKLTAAILMAGFVWMGCNKDDQPVDEDGLLITTRAECAVTNFDMLGTDFISVRSSKAVAIDTTACTVNIEVAFGTDLKNVYPQFSLSSDAKLDPKITGKTDFSDMANPRKYTVISGNRLVRKTYTVNVTVAP